jgi:uncharacterized protein
MSVGLLRFASDIMSRISIATQAGLTFGGERDLYLALGYKRTLRPQDYYDRYKRGGVAARVVEAKPKATWRAGVELVEDEDPDTNTEFEETFKELEERLQIWSTLCKADILAGLGRFAVILIGCPGALDQPMPDSLKPENLLYLTAYSEVDVQIQTYEIDPESERFGLPLLYNVRVIRTTGFDTKSTTSKLVHWTRILHVADETLDDRVYGNPRMERVWNYLDDLDKVSGAGAEAFWKRADRGLIFNADPEVILSPDEQTSLKEQSDEFQHGLKRNMVLRGIEAQPLGSDVANIQGPMDAIGTLIAGASGIPKRILFGSERGELASSQDERNWAQRIKDRRAQFAEPQLVRPFVKLLLDKGILPEPVDGYDVRWPDIDDVSENDKASIATQWCGFNTRAGGVVVTPAEIRDRILGLKKLSLEEEAVARPPAPVDPNAQEDPQAQNPPQKNPQFGKRKAAAR